MDQDNIKHMIRQRLNEELTSADRQQINREVKKQVDKQLDSKKFEKRIRDTVRSSVKDDKELEDKMVEVASNVLTQLYKTLWVRRNVWKGRLKNKAT